MRSRQAQPGDSERRQDSAAIGIEPETNPCQSLALQDAELIGRCIAGEVAAWEELFLRHHRPLLTTIKIALGGEGRDYYLVDEIAAQVWYALVENDGELLSRYSPFRGARFITFLQLIARGFAARHLRSDQRRRGREAVASQGASKYASPDWYPNLSDFLTILTPGEREFAKTHLLPKVIEGSERPQRPRTDARFWQFTRRIRQKLLGYLWGE